MTKHTTVFGDLLRHFSRSDFEKAVSGRKADYKVRKLPCHDLFKTMIYGQAAGCFSVRELATTMKVNRSRLYHCGLKEIKRSTFCDALVKRDHEIFRSVFNRVAEKAQKVSCMAKKKFKNPLRIIDATILPLCLARFDWAKYVKTKGAVKLHMNLDGDSLMPYDACITTGKVHDLHRLDELSQEKGVIYAMDRGYVDYKLLYNIELRSSYFVTRVKTNTAYKRVKNNPRKEGGPVLSDVLIELTGPKTKGHYPKALRKIKYRDQEKKRTFEFLTNDMKRDAEEVAAIYKERWEVETFFKWIKQHLKIKGFWGTSENAVYSQIWVALILQLLIWINKTLNGLKESAYELLIMIKASLLSKNSMLDLCANIKEPIPKIDCQQPLLEGFKC